MSTELSGELFEDQIHRISRTVTDKELIDVLKWFPFIVLTQPLNAVYYHSIYQVVDNETLKIFAPEGKVWTLMTGVIQYACTSDVGNRTVKLRLMNKAGVTVQYYWAPTLAADETGTLRFGHPVVDANPPNGDHLDAEFVIPSGGSLQLQATAGGFAGDLLYIWSTIKEELNFEP